MPNDTLTQYETVIGLEVHLQFSTRTKIFCGCGNEFGLPPNTRTCPVCLGLPGSLPVFNRQALTYALKVAIALNCRVHNVIKFDRKNYYYPDLPKGYQISQFDLPVAHDGFIMIPHGESEKKVRIHRAHLEEDAGKLIHDGDSRCSLVDYNRTGTPLMEIVTEPDLRSPQEAYDYLTTLKLLLSYLDVSDCDMEKGSLRCDANVSIRPAGETKLGTKTELKNMNSFKAVRTALQFEEQRQAAVLNAGERIVQETRLWDENKQSTITMRSKEEAHDYRYFPEPDLVPFIVEDSEIELIREAMPEFPDAKFARLQKRYKLSDYDARLLIQDRTVAEFFENTVAAGADPKKACNWIVGPLQQELHNHKTSLGRAALKPPQLADLIDHVEKGRISNLAGKDVLGEMVKTGTPPADIIKSRGLEQVSDDGALTALIDAVMTENPAVVEQIKGGKASAAGFLVGQVMKKSQGKANPKKIGELIQRRLLDA